MLELADVVAGYGSFQVLRHVDLEVRQGEIVCLLGGNAAGKSTTLKTVLGLLRPSKGSVTLDNERIDIDAILRAANRIEQCAPTATFRALRAADGD